MTGDNSSGSDLQRQENLRPYCQWRLPEIFDLQILNSLAGTP
jgi:hypothetical protein